MKITEIMTKRIVSVKMDDTLQVVKTIFDNANFHHLLVVEKDTLVGVVSDRDLFKALSPKLDTASETTKDLATLNKRVHQILTRELVTATIDMSIYELVYLFNRENVSCVPIVSSENKPLGIVSWRDIFKEIEMRQKEKEQK